LLSRRHGTIMRYRRFRCETLIFCPLTVADLIE
jgi:hypothetical protein